MNLSEIDSTSPPSIIAKLHRRVVGSVRGHWAAYGLLLAALAFNLFFLRGEVQGHVPALNDEVLHMQAIQRVVDALNTGQNPTDVWLGNITLGYPLLHHYQHLSYVFSALIYWPLQHALPLADFMAWSRYLLLSLFPLTIFASLRRIGFGAVAAAWAGALAPLVATSGLYGFDFISYVWSGFGLYTQLWGMLLMPLALANGYRVLRDGRGFFGAVALLAATLLTHLVLGYITALSLAALAGLRLLDWRTARDNPAHRRATLARLLGLMALVAAVSAYFLLPFMLDAGYMNRSVWEHADKYDAYGAAWTLSNLANGGLFDYGRFPVLTLLLVLGLGISLWRWREERYRVPVVMFVLWLALYFGRPTWGAWLNLLPMSRDLHFHRLIAGVHLGGIYLIGIAVSTMVSWVTSQPALRYRVAVFAVLALALFPAVSERVTYLNKSTQIRTAAQQAYEAEAKDMDALIAYVKALPPGRIYAGLAASWGKDYRVGAVPMYALLTNAGLDTFGFLWHALAINADVQPLFQDGLLSQYNLFNIRYVLTPTGWTVPKFYKPLRDFGRHRLYEVAVSGYFDLVTSPLSLTGPKSDFYSAASVWLGTPWLANKQYPAITLGAPGLNPNLPTLAQAKQALTAAAAPPPASGTIVSERVDNQSYQANLKLAQAGVALLKVTYHPDWQATIDGIPAETMLLLPGFIGVKVTAGEHEVRMVYQAKPMRGVLLLLGFLLLGLIGWVERRPKLLNPVFGFFTRTVSALRRREQHAYASEASPRVTRKTQLGLYLLLLSVYLLTSAGHFFSTDHIAVYRTSQSIIERQSLAIAPMHDAVKGQDGQYYAAFGLGQPILIMPLYLFGKWVESIGSPALQQYFGGAQLQDWGGTVPIFFVSLLNQLLTPLIGVLLFMFALRLGATRRMALALMLAYGFGTMAWVYARDSFQHPLETLCLLASIYILFAHKEALHGRHAVGAGLAIGFGVLTRISLLPVIPVLTLYVLFLAHQSAPSLELRKLAYRRLLLGFLSPVVLTLLGIMFLNGVRFGQPFTFHAPGQASGLSTPLWLGLYGNLFSVGRSIFLYSPPLLLSVFAFPSFFRRWRAEAVLFGGISAVYLLLYSTYAHWHGDWAWGPRFLIALIPLGVLVLGQYVNTPRRRWALMLLCVLGVGIQILGSTINYSYIWWDWIAMKLTPETAYLFQPDISAIPTHLRSLLAGRNVDLWLIEVYKRFGAGVLLLTSLVPLGLFALALWLLRGAGLMEGGAALRLALPDLGPWRGWVSYGRAQLVKAANTSHWLYLAVLALMVALAGRPTLGLAAMSGHDSLSYVPRTVEFYEGLRGGQWLPRWAPDLGGGHGEPLFNFNPPMLYYVMAGYRALGFGLVAAENMACFSLLALAGLSMYGLAQRFFGKQGGLVSATAYVFAPYLLTTLYVRHALMDFSIFAFIPLAVWAMHRALTTSHWRNTVMAGLGVASLFLSSNPVALITLPVLIGMMAWFALVERSARTLARGGLAIGLGLGFSAFFWLPALTERNFVHTQRLLETFLHYSNHFAAASQLLYSPWGYGVSVPGTDDGMSFAIGPLYLLLAGVAAWVAMRNRHAHRQAALMIALALGVLISSAFLSTYSSQFIWDFLPLLQYLEYPWRFHSLVAFSSALLCGALFMESRVHQHGHAPRLAIMLIGGVLAFQLPNAHPEKTLALDESLFTPENIAANNLAVTTAREYEPIWVQQRPPARTDEPLVFVSGSGRVLSKTITANSHEYVLDVAEPAQLRENTFYFPGWKLYINGTETKIDFENDQGLMTLKSAPGNYTLKLVFEDTPVRLWSLRLSLFTLLAAALIFGFATNRSFVTSRFSRIFAMRKAMQRATHLQGASHVRSSLTQEHSNSGE